MVLEVDLEEAVATQEVVATEEVDTVLLLMVLLTLHQEASEAAMYLSARSLYGWSLSSGGGPLSSYPLSL